MKKEKEYLLDDPMYKLIDFFPKDNMIQNHVYLKKLMNILLLDFIGYYSVIWNNDYNTGIKYIDGKLVEITEDEFLKDIKSNIDCWKADFHKLRREIKEAFGTIYNEDQKNNPSCRVFENCLYNDFLTIFCRDKLQHDLDFEDTNGKKKRL